MTINFIKHTIIMIKKVYGKAERFHGFIHFGIA
jgi:hypothetical protein